MTDSSSRSRAICKWCGSEMRLIITDKYLKTLALKCMECTHEINYEKKLHSVRELLDSRSKFIKRAMDELKMDPDSISAVDFMRVETRVNRYFIEAEKNHSA